MKNALMYYYSLNPENVHQNDGKYYFKINNISYCLSPYNDSPEKLAEVNDLHISLLNNRFPCHEIIPNVNSQIVTVINNQFFILLKINIYDHDQKINFNDLLIFNNLKINYNKGNNLLLNDWKILWSEKIDYYEYQVNQLGKKYPLIRESFAYYNGLTETAIQILNNLSSESYYLTISHRRINIEDTLFDLYNPLLFILDNKVRNVAEIYKSQYFNSDVQNFQVVLSNYIVNANLNQNECCLLLARLLYPSYYFDVYEKILKGETEEKDLNLILNKSFAYECTIKELYEFIKSFQKIPVIEWLEIKEY